MTIALTPTRASLPAGPISTPNQVVTTFTLTNATGTDSGAFALALTETNGGEFSYEYSINGGSQTNSGNLNVSAATPFSPANITGLDLAAAAVLTLVVTAQVPFDATGGNYSFEIAWSGAGVTSGNSTSTVALSDPLAIENVPSTYTGSVGAQFEFTVSAFEGTTPYVFSAIGLPTGVTINSATGVVSGMPLAPGNYMATFTVTDASSVTNSANTTIVVWSDDVFEQDIPPKLFVSDNRVKIPPQQFWVVGQPITPIGVFFGGRTGFTAPFAYSATNLPAGISINASTGLLSGTPIGELTNAPIVITITDANNLRYRAGFYALIVENSADASQQALQFEMDVKPQNGFNREPVLSSLTSLANNTQAVMAAQYPQASGGGGGGGGTPAAPVIVQSAVFIQPDGPFVVTQQPAEGNLLVMFISHNSLGTINPAWTKILNLTSAVNDYPTILYRVVDSDDTESLAPITGSGGCCAAMFELSGADTDIPSTIVGLADQTHTSETVSVGAPAGSIVLGAFTTTGNDSLPALTGGVTALGTLAQASGSGANWPRGVAAYEQSFATQGNMTCTATYGSSINTNVYAVVIQGR